MSSESVDYLLDTGLFETTGNGELTLGKRARERLDGARKHDPQWNGDLDGVIGTQTDDADVTTALRGIAETDPEFVERYAVVSQLASRLSDPEILQTTFLVSQLHDDELRVEGAPEPFVHVDGNVVPDVVSLYERCLVYVWRENCSPCSKVKDKLGRIFAEPGWEGLMLLSVFGPDSAVTLHEEFDVVGGPTLLYILNGEVHSRLTGVPHIDTIRHEADVLCQQDTDC